MTPAGPSAALLLAATLLAGCSDPTHVFGVYAHDTRALVRLDYDFNADGVIDVRTYMRDGRPVRLEGDSDNDGLIDRWEYYSADGRLVRVGSSSRGDGREDTWARPDGDEVVIEISSRRDNTIDRRERRRNGVLWRVELDTNGDGLPDAWQQFENGAIVALLLDEDKRHGRPTRRLVYGGGAAATIETDPDGDGRFTPIDLAAQEISDATR